MYSEDQHYWFEFLAVELFIPPITLRRPHHEFDCHLALLSSMVIFICLLSYFPISVNIVSLVK